MTKGQATLKTCGYAMLENFIGHVYRTHMYDTLSPLIVSIRL